MTSTLHKWAKPERLPYKTERECSRCEMVKVTRHEWERGRDVYWTEFWRDLERVDENGETPPCDARLEVRGQHDQQQIGQQLRDSG
jgi:hypothetical protein